MTHYSSEESFASLLELQCGGAEAISFELLLSHLVEWLFVQESPLLSYEYWTGFASSVHESYRY